MMRWILDLFWFFRYLQREYWWMRMHRRGTESQTYRLHWTCWRQSMFYQMSNDGTSQIRILRRRAWMGLYLRVWRRVQCHSRTQNQLIFADWFLVLLSSLLFGLKAKIKPLSKLGALLCPNITHPLILIHHVICTENWIKQTCSHYQLLPIPFKSPFIKAFYEPIISSFLVSINFKIEWN